MSAPPSRGSTVSWPILGPSFSLWEDCLRLPDWSGPEAWFHGDLHPANVIVTERHVSAIIDFGHVGTGDPACDLLIAWTMLTPRARGAFRQRLAVDDTTWLRGRAWALAIGAAAVAYSAPGEVLARVGRSALAEVMADAGEVVAWVDEQSA